MGRMEYYKPVMVALVLQFIYAGMTLLSKACFLEGMSPRVFVVYRQAFGTLFIAPVAYFSRSKTNKCSMNWKSFSLIFLAALIGLTISQFVTYEGIFLASSTASSILSNLTPAITFVIASIIGFEPIDLRSIRTVAKILGTCLCVVGAVAMTLIKGPKLLSGQLPSSNSLFLNSTGSENQWLLGCLCLFAGSCCWALWLIIQVPLTKIYPDRLSASAWMCFLGTLQSAAITVFTDDLESWKISSYLELVSCIYVGVFASGIAIVAQFWIIERKGPVFSVIFNPLNAIIVTILASILLHEQIYVGSVVGAFGIIIGLYVVLWGKAKDFEMLKEEQEKKKMIISQVDEIKILVDEPNLLDPLLPKEI